MGFDFKLFYDMNFIVCGKLLKHTVVILEFSDMDP